MPEGRFVVEQAPAWGEGSRRGVVGEGAVGARALGRFRLFRYEIRSWREGVIPDLAEAVESPVRLSEEPEYARRLLELAPHVPTPVWGRDELGAGEMWNSNSTVSWLLASSGLDVESVSLPHGGQSSRLASRNHDRASPTVSLTNATAFSPTDAMPLTRPAKALMAAESTLSVVTVLLVAARAVNILI